MALPGGLVPPEALARFRTEAEAIARLDHPNIVRVYECGEQDRRPYFSMELIEGPSLAQKLKAGPLPGREAAGLVQALARAVSFAHQKGVIHRDLKPANVLLAADGSVKLTDFGLAKLLDAEAGQTQRDTILGTASYMAPEQARGDVAAEGPLADVYGLGAVLYECLTGSPPFKGETRTETLELVKAQQPVPPRKLRGDVPPHLEAVCLKCLAKAPGRRYRSASALADDLGRWLQAERPPAGRWPTRTWNALGRGRWAGASAALALALAAAVLLWALGRRPPQGPSSDLVGQSGGPPVVPHATTHTQDDPLTLVGQSGSPSSSRWRLGRESSAAWVDGPDKVFKMSSRRAAFLELCARPPWRNYRLEAQVRHEENTGVGSVGVGFAYREDSAGTHSGFSQLSFVDRGRRRGEVEVAMHAYRHGPRPETNYRLRSKYYRPSGPDGGPGPWRQLALEVAGGRARLFWEGDRVGEMNRTEWERAAASLSKKHPGLPSAPPEQGGLGLFVQQSTASFRQVVVRPLPEGD
jgi:serine/threonine-protein kinase